MDKLDLDLEGERRKLIVDDTQIAKKEDVKKKSRMNWFKMQEERERKEQELVEKMRQQEQKLLMDQEKSKLIIDKIERTIA